MSSFRSDRVGRSGRAGGLGIAWRVGVFVGLAWLGSAGTTVLGQGPARGGSQFYPDSSDTAETLLRNAANHARERQWSEAIEIYQRVIDQYGDKVAKLPKDEPGTEPSGDFALYVDGRQFCHRCLAQLPAEARAVYRSRADGLAESWYRQGWARRDAGLLRRVIDRAFCSSWGDDALELLGDLAFQDGRFGEALAMYGRLVADRPDDASVLVHPDPSVDLAKVAAKKLLCRAAWENPPTRRELDDFDRRYPGAAGSLAGRKGSYATILAESLAADHLQPPAQPDSRWPTFAGSPRRSRVVAGPIDVGQVQWRVELEKVAPLRSPGSFPSRMSGPATPPASERLLAFHPIVLGDQVLVCDGSRVLAYNLNDRPGGPDGSESRPLIPAWRHDPDGAAVPQATRNAAAIPRYTLTAVGSRIYARMGFVSTTTYAGRGARFGPMTIGEIGSSSIVALDWNTQGKLLWEQKSANFELPDRPAGATRTVNFEGTPVADLRNVYVAVTDRREQTATYVACLDAETGTRRWIRYLGTATPEFDHAGGFGMGMTWNINTPGDYHHRLLSLDGPTLYYQTNLGALIALDAETGATLWVATYPRKETHRFGPATERDLNPAVVHEGRVLIAPSDSDAIFAFDASSGRRLWKTQPISDDIKLTHLLGVAQGRLVATGDRVLLFDVQTGKLLSTWPDSAGKAMEGYGRGLLAGERIYWPTRTHIQVLDQRTGLLAEPPIKLAETYRTTGGNLAAGDGYLVVAQADGLVVFCQNSRLIERYREEIARAPDQASNHYRLARAAEAVGRDELSLDSYRQAIAKARPSEMIDGMPLSGTARDRMVRLLLRLAGRSRRDRRWDEAIARLESAAEIARTDPERLEARLLLADILLDAGRPRDALEALEQLLSDGRLRPLPIATADGHRTIRADLLIADRLGAIVRQHGRAIYEPFDRQAAALFHRGKDQRDPHVLDEVCRDYPLARVVPEALLELGRLSESSGRLAEAAAAYKRLLALAPDDQTRALAIWSLGRIYDARKLFVSARDAYLELLARYPTVRLPQGEHMVAAAELATAELAREPYAHLVADRPQPPIPSPMIRRWQWQAPADRTFRALGTAGIVPSPAASRVVLCRRDDLRLLDPAHGTTRWSSELGAPAVWAGYLADKLIVATPRRIVALELAQGSLQWRYDLDGSGKEAARPDPFAVAGEGDDRPERVARTLHDFHLVKGRLFCLRGQDELIALDGDSGALDWSFAAPPGAINPHFFVGADRVVLQLDKPNQLLVLRTEDGQPVARSPLGERDWLERPPLPVEDDAVLVVTDPRTVKKIEVNRGQTVWDYRESEELPVNGPPRLLGDAEHVLVLHNGRNLIRLDPATGSRRWSCLLGTEDLSDRPTSIAFDEERLYCISRCQSLVTLRAVALADGTAAWACHWAGPEDSAWSIALAAHHVIAYPNHTGLAEDGALESIPVVVRRRETGVLVQRFVLPAPVAAAAAKVAATESAPQGDVTLRIDSGGALVATPRGVWGLGPKDH